MPQPTDPWSLTTSHDAPVPAHYDRVELERQVAHAVSRRDFRLALVALRAIEPLLAYAERRAFVLRRFAMLRAWFDATRWRPAMRR